MLAGGESRRLGQDKSRLQVTLGGEPKTLLWWAVARLAQVCEPVLIAAGDRHLAEVDELRTAFDVGVEAVADGIGAGPIAGLLGAAAVVPGRRCLVLACDLPLVPLRVLRALAGCTDGWAAPGRHGQLESTCAIYGPSAIARLARRAAGGEWALHGLRSESGLDFRELGPAELGLDEERSDEWPDDWSTQWSMVFLNINRAEDLVSLSSAQARLESDYSEVAAAAAAVAANASISSKKSKR